MAPKPAKRKEVSPPASPVKKPAKVESPKKRRKVDPIKQKIEEVIEAIEDYDYTIDATVRETLVRAVPHTLDTFVSSRHEYQAHMVTWIDNTFNEVEVQMQALVAEKQGELDEAKGTLDQHNAELEAKEKELAGNKETEEDKQRGLDEDKQAVKNASAALDSATAELEKVEKEKGTLTKEQEVNQEDINSLEALSQDSSDKKALKAGCSRLDKALKKLDLPESLRKCLGPALAASERGGFDAKVTSYVKVQLEAQKERLADALANWEPNRLAAEGAVNNASQVLEDAKAKCASSSDDLQFAKAAVATSKKEITALEKQIVADNKLVTKKEEGLEDAEGIRGKFTVAKESFVFLRDREAEPEVAEEVAEEVVEAAA